MLKLFKSRSKFKVKVTRSKLWYCVKGLVTRNSSKFEIPAFNLIWCFYHWACDLPKCRTTSWPWFIKDWLENFCMVQWSKYHCKYFWISTLDSTLIQLKYQAWYMIHDTVFPSECRTSNDSAQPEWLPNKDHSQHWNYHSCTYPILICGIDVHH